MAQVYTSLRSLLDHGFDTVIDVRSPSEFAEDHIPGAINLPVLDDAERAKVGTVYKQQSPFRARKIGAALVFRNAAEHVAGPLAGHDGGWRPLVYCWRGGQRSGSFGWMLGQIGWRSDVIQGGYQTYRRLVHDYLYSDILPHRILLLDGNTGTAKTEILHRLYALGHQVLDLEGAARHRGSLLGGLGPQPSQKAFESEIAGQLCRMDPQRPVVIEAESNKIGARIIPPALWKAMGAAQRLEVRAPVAARADYLAQVYADVLEDGPALLRKLEPLRAVRGREVLQHWRTLVDTGDKTALTRALIEDHYDPAYTKSRRTRRIETVAEIETMGLSDAHLTQVTGKISTILDKMV